MSRSTFVAIVICGLSASPSIAQTSLSRPDASPSTAAQMSSAVPASVKELRGQLGASVNELGIQQSFELTWRHGLSSSTNPLLSDAHWSIGGTTAFTPAHVRGGLFAELAPLSILVVRAGLEPSYYFGTFDSLTSFTSRRDVFDPDTRRDLNSASSGAATRFYVAPTVQLRVGRIVGASTASFERWSSSAHGPFFYESTRDTLLNVNGDSLMTLTSGVLYEHPQKTGTLSVGAMHALTRIDGKSLNSIQRIGVLAIKQFDRRIAGLSRPSVTLNVSRYLDDPSKHGEWSAAMAVGFDVMRK